jgi:hypothetical protein
MLAFKGIARFAGTLCLIGAGVLPSAHADEPPTVCDAAWHATAEQHAAWGIAMAQDYGAGGRVRLWRLLTLDEDEPARLIEPYYGYPPHLILPDSFPDDPDVARISELIHHNSLAEAVTAIEALTRIPDPAQSDIATERLLVRSELQFAGVLWADGWIGDDGVSEIGARAQKWMALLNAHFMSLPRAILDHDLVVNAAYWRAVEDLRWFLRSDRNRDWYRDQQTDDWWLPEATSGLPVVAGVALATRESEFLDWLQSMEAVNSLGSRGWIAYLGARFKQPDYENAFAHVVAMAKSKAEESKTALAWRIAVSRWWAPERGRNGQFRGAEEAIQSRAENLEQRAATCALSVAEQYALGPLRHNALRQRALDAQGMFDRFWWDDRDRIKPEEAETVDDETRREVTRFTLAVGQSELARAFQTAITPKGDDASIVPMLRALTATDLDSFAAANPDPSAFNLLPLKLLADLIERPGLRPDLRAAVTRVAWVRAYVLKNDAILKRITPLLASTNPQMKPLVDAYQAPWTEAGQRHAALVLLLKAPGMQMVLPGDSGYWGVERVRIWSDKDEDWRDAQLKSDHLNPNDNNWWCRLDLNRLNAQLRHDFYDAPLGLASGYGWGPEGRYDFSTPLWESIGKYRDQVLRDHAILKQIDWEELGALTKIANAPTFLSEEAVDWAESSWWDRTFHADEIAEALALSVQATRWGCHRDGSNAPASYRAYRTLHERFPDRKAAQATLYWYK